ncbi:MAG: 1-phosphofructokinase [Actinomyces sp.]|nr:MAG: 1-phosphofructokinase [Actinomyces sp.]
MILTVTPNPGFDRTVRIDHLTRGAVLRTTSTLVEPAGKGINVALATVVNGGRARAVFPAGAGDREPFEQHLTRAGAEAVAVPITGRVRTNLTVVEADGTTTKINEAGPTLAADEVDALVAAVRGADEGARYVVVAGSLPPGVDGAVIDRLAGALPDPAGRLVVDSSGAALGAATTASCALIKPNREELESLVGEPLTTLDDVVDAARGLLDGGPRAVLVSLGAEGAVLVDADGAVHGRVSVDGVANTVGAGDALLAGFLAGGGRGPAALAEALAWARAAVTSPGTVGRPVTDADRAAVHVADGVPPRSGSGVAT